MGKRTDLFGRDPKKVPITDFFGSVRNVELTREVINLAAATNGTVVMKKAEHCPADGAAAAAGKDQPGCERGESYEYVAQVFHYAPELPVLDELERKTV